MEAPRPRKRKAIRPAVVKAEPVQKKVKRSLAETDEEWQKYVKQKTAKAVPKKEGVAVNKKKVGEQVTATTAKQKKKKKTNPLLKHREPCDLMRNEERVEELNSKVEVIENINEENCQQKTLAINVMPARARQTAETLSLSSDSANHIVYNDVDFCMEMKRLNYERTANAVKNGAEQSLPLQQLMGDEGFFSFNNEHVDQVVKCIIKANRTDIAYARRTQAENTDGSTLALQEKKKISGPVGDTSNKKLNIISGGVFYSFGYTKRTPQLQYKKLNSHDVIDRERRFKEYYKFDQLETETNFGEIPDNFKMFRELEKQNMEKYLKRNDALGLTAALMPKTDLEIVSKEYIDAFREPPAEGEESCANREQCVFNTFSSDKNVCYIGKVFFTEKERERGELNTHRLCIDCLLTKWTIEWVLNIRHEIVPERAINYFSVMCKPGQYSPHCMLSVIENDKPTGIVGHVTRFSHNNRRIVTRVRHLKRDGKYHQISVPVLEETGLDF